MPGKIVNPPIVKAPSTKRKKGAADDRPMSNEGSPVITKVGRTRRIK